MSVKTTKKGIKKFSKAEKLKIIKESEQRSEDITYEV